jgi:hypothetical protein
MNRVLVDFENVRHTGQGIIGARSVSLTILVGAEQTRLCPWAWCKSLGLGRCLPASVDHG